MNLVIKIYEETEDFPETEKFGLISQLRRSAISIPSNIAEGYGRNSKAEFSRFLDISMGSLFEVQTQLQIAQSLEYLNSDSWDTLFELSREIERMLSSFMESIKN